MIKKMFSKSLHVVSAAVIGTLTMSLLIISFVACSAFGFFSFGQIAMLLGLSDVRFMLLSVLGLLSGAVGGTYGVLQAIDEIKESDNE